MSRSFEPWSPRLLGQSTGRHDSGSAGAILDHVEHPDPWVVILFCPSLSLGILTTSAASPSAADVCPPVDSSGAVSPTGFPMLSEVPAR
jgi:hypothetical protein